MKDVFDRMRLAPYWWDAAPRVAQSPPPLPDQIDVLVIGAGYTGLCAALVLAKAGRSVLVCEAGFLGAGASTRNGGMLGPRLVVRLVDSLIKEQILKKNNILIGEVVLIFKS